MFHRKSLLSAVGVAAATLVVASSASAAVGTTASQSDVIAAGALSPDTIIPIAATPDPVVGVEPAALNALPTFRDLPATPMPASVAQAVGSPLRFGRNPNLARQLDTVTGKGWLIPGRGYVCLAVPDPVDGYATTCQPTADVAQHGIQISLGNISTKAPLATTTVAPNGDHVLAAAPGQPASIASTNHGVSSALVSPDVTVSVAAS